MQYQLQRKTGVEDWADLVTLVDTLAYDDLSLPFGTYSYRIRAISGALISSWVNLSSVEVLDIITDWHLIGEGNSIVASGDPLGPMSHVRLLPAEYNPEPGLNVLAISGTNMTDMIARQPAVVAVINAQISSRELVITSIMMGNGLIEMSPLQLYEAYLQYADDIRAVDPQSVIVFCDTAYRNNAIFAPGWDVGNGAVVTEFNDYVALDPSRMDAYIPWHLHAFGTFAAASDLTLYYDGIHQTQLCYDLMLPVEKAIIDQLLSGQRPVCLTLPSIDGLSAINQTFTVDEGIWSPDSDLTFQWFRTLGNIAVPISGAISNQYVTTSTDVGEQIKCNVTGTHMGIPVCRASEFSDVIITFYGIELLQNNKFGGSNATSWDEAGGGIRDATTNKLRLTQAGGFVNARLKQIFLTTVGQIYEFNVDFTKGVNAPDGKTFIMNGEGGSTLGTVDYTANGHYTLNFTAGGPNTYIDLRDPALAIAGSTWFWDNISVRHVSTDRYEEYIAENFTAATYTVVGPGALSVVGPGNGPGGISTEYTLTIPIDSYYYKPFLWNTIFNADIGDTVLFKVWVQGTAGQKIGLGLSDVAPGDYLAHTFNGGWEEVSLRRTTINGVTPLFGFDNRAAIIPGVGLGSATFKVWGISYRF